MEDRRDANTRHQHREGDGWWATLFAMMLRQGKARLLAVSGAIFSLVGAFAGILIMRFIVLERVDAQDSEHRSMITVNANAIDVLELRADSMAALRTDVRTLIKSECLRTSKAMQDRLEMTCPENLYLGAPP